MTSARPSEARAGANPPGRIPRLLSRLGLAALCFLVLAALFFADVLAWGFFRSGGSPPPGAMSFDMDLRARDGSPLGSARGVPLILSAAAFYENFPDSRADHVRINSLGFRGGEPAEVPASRLLALLGGSTAFGLLVDENETLGSAIETRLPGMSVMNCGVPGYCSGQELNLYFARVMELEPAIVVSLSGWNDLYDQYWWIRFRGAPKAVPEANSAFMVMEARLADHERLESDPLAAFGSGLVRLATAGSAGALARRIRPAEPVPSGVTSMGDHTYLETLKLYVSNMARIRDLAEWKGGRFVVVLQPEIAQLFEIDGSALPGDGYSDAFPALYARFRRDAAALLRDRSVSVIDATELLLDAGATPDWFLDACHLTPTGYSALALALSREEFFRTLRAGDPDAINRQGDAPR